jgi:hypothetical protein
MRTRQLQRLVAGRQNNLTNGDHHQTHTEFPLVVISGAKILSVKKEMK